MALRFANSLFEPVWNSRYIDHVQITVAEEVGLESRAGYYDTAGAMRDMIQNHILQLLCLTAMEMPTSLDADRVRDEKLKVLNSLEPLTQAQVAQNTVRGQYTAGASLNGPVRGYLEELGHPTSMTETFVALKAEVGNWRWAGVPFYLRTGKRLPTRVSEIVVQFRPIPHTVFEETAGQLKANRLVIRVQPDEGVKLWLMIKDPGPGGMRLQYVPLDMTFAKAFSVRNPDAYERLIMDVVRGNQTLFMRGDEVEAAWRWVDPIMDAWMASGRVPEALSRGHLGPLGLGRTPRARRPHLARRVGTGLPVVSKTPALDRGGGFLYRTAKGRICRVARSTMTVSSAVFAVSPSLAGWYAMRSCSDVTTMRR